MRGCVRGAERESYRTAQQVTRRTNPHPRYVIAKIINGRAVAWFRYSRTEVWTWRKDPKLGHRFPSVEAATLAAENSTMSYAHEWRVDRYR